MRALRVTVASSLAAVVAGASAWAWGEPGFGSTEILLSALALLGALATLVAVLHDRVGTRVAVACVLLLGPPALRIGELCGATLPYVNWDHDVIASLTSLALVAAVVGLLRRKLWARWLGLGGSLAGLGSSLLNGLGTLVDPGVLTWGHALAVAGCGALVLLLGGSSMRDAFEGSPSEAELWRSPDPVVRALRWALITTLIAAPMLLVYAFVQPIVPGTKAVALTLAGLQITAALLCVRRKLVGAMLLVMAGAVLLVFTVVCAAATHGQGPTDPWILSYYAVFWVPAGVISLVAGAVLLRPLATLLRR